MLVEKEELWYRHGTVRRGRLKERDNHCSAWWRSLCRVREGLGDGVENWFEDNTRRVVGDRRDALFWHDIWVGEIPMKIKFPRLY